MLLQSAASQNQIHPKRTKTCKDVLRLWQQIERSLKHDVPKSSVFGSSEQTSRGLLQSVQHSLWCRNSGLLKKEEEGHHCFSCICILLCLDRDLRFGHKHHRVTATQRTCSEQLVANVSVIRQSPVSAHLPSLRNNRSPAQFWRAQVEAWAQRQCVNLDPEKERKIQIQLHLLARKRPWSSHLENRYNNIYLGRVL